MSFFQTIVLTEFSKEEAYLKKRTYNFRSMSSTGMFMGTN